MNAAETAVADAPDEIAALPPPTGGRVAGLFAGIGGIELGLHAAGYQTSLLCEIEPAAQSVLRAHFPNTDLIGDVAGIDQLRDVDIVTAGFPCQDLSQAGRTVGIGGARSGLVDEVFRLLRGSDPRWVLLENVPFMLQLDRGRAMRHLTTELGALGFRWAYRVVDARAFGLPQRRQRVILVASRTEDPCGVLFADEAGEPPDPDRRGRACGFYWTEGIRGLGWAVDAIPTLKGGSTIGIPSAPAVWMPMGFVGTPDLRDAERLQGFAADWTKTSVVEGRRGIGARWKMVGNAVSVPVARWVGRRLAEPGRHRQWIEPEVLTGEPWPRAARGHGDQAFRVDLSAWPVRELATPLADFLDYPLVPLSVRACEGFLSRAARGSLRFPDGLLDAVRAHARAMRERPAA